MLEPSLSLYCKLWFHKRQRCLSHPHRAHYMPLLQILYNWEAGRGNFENNLIPQISFLSYQRYHQGSLGITSLASSHVWPRRTGEQTGMNGSHEPLSSPVPHSWSAPSGAGTSLISVPWAQDYSSWESLEEVGYISWWRLQGRSTRPKASVKSSQISEEHFLKHL